MHVLTEIGPNDLRLNINELWDDQWMLLTAGDFKTGHFNTMTVAWGSLGIMWNKPFAMVVVRPTRYTFEFMNRYPDFTLTAFPKEYRKDLSFLGKRSGRDGDKITKTQLHPVASEKVNSPAFAEAELILECRKMYWDDLDTQHFMDDKILETYEKRDTHRIYFGEILSVRSVEKYISG